MGVRLAWATLINYIDTTFARSWVAGWFHIEQRQSKLSREIRAGTVTFLTASYILAVNGFILGQTGGPCSVADCTGDHQGDERCKFADSNGDTDPGYQDCLDRVQHSLVTATALSALFATLLMGAGANLPIVCAPGMGLNAYFYSVVGYRGSGSISYGAALTAVFLEGLVFVGLAVTGLRARFIRLVPRSVMLATATGIGLYLAFIGMQTAEGLGVVSFDPNNYVTIGGCDQSHQAPVYIIPDDRWSKVCDNRTTGKPSPNLPVPDAYVHYCTGGKMSSGTLWLGLAGLLLTTIMMSRSFRAAIITGIAFVTFVAWIPHTRASYLGKSSPVPGGQDRLDYFKNVAVAPNVMPTGAKLDWGGVRDGQFWIALLTFLYVDFLDTTGTLFSMASYLNQYLPGFINKDKTFPRSTMAFSVDGLGTMLASLVGSSPVATFIESAAGIREGGRTGLTALTACFWFFLAIFFTPILSSVPPYAVGGALITVGALMMLNVVRINWDKSGEAIPAFLTICVMPFTYSIAYGIIAGLVSYIVVNGINWILDNVMEAYAWQFLRGNEPALPTQSEGSFWNQLRSNKHLAGGLGNLGERGLSFGKQRISSKSSAWIFNSRRPTQASAGGAAGSEGGDGAAGEEVPGSTPRGASESPSRSRRGSFGQQQALEVQGPEQGPGRGRGDGEGLGPSLPLSGRGLAQMGRSRSVGSESQPRGPGPPSYRGPV